MPLIHNCEQYSAEWDMLRIGKATASQFFRIITPTGKRSDQYKDYAYNLLAEIMLKRSVDTYKSEHMERGAELEPEAANYYEFEKGLQTQRVGFITDDAKRIGCSPDRLVGNTGLLEIKCPKPNTMIKYMIEESIEDKYKPQIQGQLFITEREWLDIISYHPDMLDANIIMRVTRDDVYCRLLEQYLKDFQEFMGECLIKMRQKVPQLFAPDAIEELTNVQ